MDFDLFALALKIGCTGAVIAVVIALVVGLALGHYLF